MNAKTAWRATKQWVPFVTRTALYGTASLVFGPLTSDRRASLWAMRQWCKSSARGLRIDVVAYGVERAPEGAFVYASNHQSVLDVLVLGSVLAGDFKWAAKRSMMKVPFLGWHLKLAGHVPVDRGRGPKAAQAVIDRFTQVLRAGKPLLVFPEGTRSRDGNISAFKAGGFIAACRANTPVVPVALIGTFDLMKPGDRDTGEGQVRRVVVCVGEPLYPRFGLPEPEQVADLTARTRAAVVAMFEAGEPKGKPRSSSVDAAESALL